MLASMQESHKQYEEQISVLQESLEKEEQCKKGLEDLQQRLYKEIADRVQVYIFAQYQNTKESARCYHYAHHFLLC